MILNQQISMTKPLKCPSDTHFSPQIYPNERKSKPRQKKINLYKNKNQISNSITFKAFFLSETRRCNVLFRLIHTNEKQPACLIYCYYILINSPKKSTKIAFVATCISHFVIYMLFTKSNKKK